ncbi:MAG: hypothetical protein EAZ77_11485, partial [Nostocales cyanobacterium]
KAGGREQGAGGKRFFTLFTFRYTVWFYYVDLLNLRWALPTFLLLFSGFFLILFTKNIYS